MLYPQLKVKCGEQAEKFACFFVGHGTEQDASTFQRLDVAEGK